MKKLALFLLLSATAFGQAVRIGDGTPVSSTLAIQGTGTVLAPSSAPIIAVCSNPANAVPCTNKATTYTDFSASVSCSTSTQVTLPGTNTCVAAADSLGNWGAWVLPGCYDYTITTGGRSFGPYTVCAGGSTGAVPKAYNLASVPLTPTPSDGTLYKILDNQRGYYQYDAAQSSVRPISADINVQDFGARGDGGTYVAGNCTSGSPTVGVAVTFGRYVRAGDTLVMSGCGTAGADLMCTVASVTGTLTGTATCGGGVTAGATLTGRGIRWGSATNVDDTAAFQAAINYCSITNPNHVPNGCRIRVPQGIYFVSNLTFPAYNSAGVGGQIQVWGVGRTSSLIVGIGANQTAIFTAPANSTSTDIEYLGIISYDSINKSQIPVQWKGGTEHNFSNNYVSSTYGMVNAANTWINLISNNRCYGMAAGSSCIEFGGLAGTGPVNATRVVFNEFAIWSATGHAVYTHTNNASYGNTYAFNSTENDNPPFGETWVVHDSQSHFDWEYTEESTSGPASGYLRIIYGDTNIINSPSIPCMQVVGNNNQIAGSPSSACPGQTYTIKNDGTSNRYTGSSFGSGTLSALNTGAVISGTSSSGTGASMYMSGFSVYPYIISTSQDWANARVDIAGTTFGRSSNGGAGLNPSAPGEFGTAATVPFGSVIQNRSFQLDSPVNSGYFTNTWWVCLNSPNCATNPIVATQWGRIGELSKRVRTEDTSKPTTGTWQTGDWVWNTAAGSMVQGWSAQAGGSSGATVWVRQPITQTATNTGCATAASAGSTCTTTVTWPTAFPNTNYKAVCDGNLITSGVPLAGGQTAKASGTVTFQTVAATAAAAQFTNIHCAAWAD